MFQCTSLHSHKILPLSINSDGDHRLLASSGYQLPLCWLMLFQESDLQVQKVYSNEGEQTCEYTTLICSKAEALPRYQLAAERFKRLLGQRCDTYFDYWHQYLEYNADEYLFLDATALWMTGDEQAYLDNLNLSLSGIRWVMSDECPLQPSRLASLPFIGRFVDPLAPILKHEGLRHLLIQSNVLDADGGIYIDKSVLQGNI
ncbi:hypothetical protein EH243_10230 [Amphritea opalescens]|uniref:Uncharacterized protein n=1 Tax=Amphritea opalescens TaxID=2490544 RepID=A0A430KQ99_9GAMM|nr:hypothetical protein [Amphritea opalescens]RTE65645.1 hypothetical protein EH243_10230 [Amphritea opalescens]